jgi:hypothetical protein
MMHVKLGEGFATLHAFALITPHDFLSFYLPRQCFWWQINMN